jgi:hypothetical protein
MAVSDLSSSQHVSETSICKQDAKWRVPSSGI